MKFCLGALVAVCFTAQIAEGSFLQDVVGTPHKENAIDEALLSKAIPLDQYRANLRAKGYDISQETRNLEDNAYDDDYYMSQSDMHSFSGYSLKYAACQPVQKFSEDAIYAGEYNPMILDDIVVLRLCPSNNCLANRKFGCTSNYADYAIGISDYIRIMLRHQMDKKQQLCNWCNACSGRRNLQEENEDEDGNENQDENEQNQEENNQEEENQDNEQAADEENQNDGEDGDQAAGDDALDGDNGNVAAAGDDAYSNYGAGYEYDDNYASSDGCNDYETYCYADGVSVCAENGDDDGKYLDTEDYLDYLECTNVNNYYLRPRCNGYDQTIKMGIYYDPFCSQYAGDQVSINSLGLGISRDAFEEFYSNAACIDCSESNVAPYFNATAIMCNRMQLSSAACASNLQNSNSNSSDSSACSYIDSLRLGTYDEQGRWSTGSATREMTSSQKWGLSLSLLLCAVLAVYSCYLHHSITNLLIRSLSHTDLLPPSSRSRRGSYRQRNRSSRRPTESSSDESDWDDEAVKKHRSGSSRSRSRTRR